MYLRKKSAFVVLLAAGISLVPALSKADGAYSPTRDGGNFGLGLELGDPGTWGVSGKVWVDHENAFQGAVKFPGGSALLQLDYLWHDFHLIHMKSTEGEWPFYIGVGGDLSTNNPVQVAGRVPIGMSYIFDKRNVPVDIFIQLVPTLWLTQPTDFYLYGEFGAHYYF